MHLRVRKFKLHSLDTYRLLFSQTIIGNFPIIQLIILQNKQIQITSAKFSHDTPNISWQKYR